MSPCKFKQHQIVVQLVLKFRYAALLNKNDEVWQQSKLDSFSLAARNRYVRQLASTLCDEVSDEC